MSGRRFFRRGIVIESPRRCSLIEFIVTGRIASLFFVGIRWNQEPRQLPARRCLRENFFRVAQNAARADEIELESIDEFCADF
jgi:hypothetical protein